MLVRAPVIQAGGLAGYRVADLHFCLSICVTLSVVSCATPLAIFWNILLYAPSFSLVDPFCWLTSDLNCHLAAFGTISAAEITVVTFLHLHHKHFPTLDTTVMPLILVRVGMDRKCALTDPYFLMVPCATLNMKSEHIFGHIHVSPLAV